MDVKMLQANVEYYPNHTILDTYDLSVDSLGLPQKFYFYILRDILQNLQEHV